MNDPVSDSNSLLLLCFVLRFVESLSIGMSFKGSGESISSSILKRGIAFFNISELPEHLGFYAVSLVAFFICANRNHVFTHRCLDLGPNISELC